MDYSEEVSGTLRAQEHGRQPLVFENHGIDARYTGPYDVAPTMAARYGTGGNNTPLVARDTSFCITGNAIDRKPENGGNGLGIDEDVAFTLTATDHHAVFARQRTDVFREDEVASTESARQHKDATDLVLEAQDEIKPTQLIRRLMPIEFADENTLIYGHHMQSGRMFACLVNYADQEYYNEHPFLYLETPDARYKVVLFSGYTTESWSSAYNVRFSSEDDYVDWLREIVAKSDFSVAEPITISTADHIVTLSTCAYSFEDARYVVHGKLVERTPRG